MKRIRLINLQPVNGNTKIAINPDHIAAIKEDRQGKVKVYISSGDFFTVNESFEEVHSWIRGE